MPNFPNLVACHIDIDRYLNPYIPPSPLRRFPKWISRFLGYRERQEQDVGNVIGACWSLLGAFCGLAVIAAVFNNVEEIQKHHPPSLIASFGASAILEYNAIRSPLGQPRNALLGHTLSAIIGVGITKLFQLHSDFLKIRWIAGSVACGTSSAVMLITGTVHPPGGASAVLAATNDEITNMGWYFVPLVMLGTTLMLIVGLITNNIQRQFPVYWWTPIDLRQLRKKEDQDAEIIPDAQGGLEVKHPIEEEDFEPSEGINISADRVTLPGYLSLNPDEAALLETLKDRLRKSRDSEESRLSLGSSTECTIVPSHGAGSESEAAFSPEIKVSNI